MRIVIITGGSRGIGASIAVQCAKRGMGVILTYNSNTQAAKKVVSAIEAGGGKAVALELDVGSSAAFPAFHDAVGQALATIWSAKSFDFLVNNAGYGLYNSIATVNEDDFDGLFRVHLKGPFFLT